MDVLQQAYKVALDNNYEETQRWKKYQEDHQQALLNMQTFIKKLEVEIMVPIGSKALVPGYLCRTNEILVSHYGGLFSRCSSSKALEICKYRLKLAKERLEGLEKERDMYQNKAEIPFNDGILPREDQQDIVEEYDEEKEKLWREEHKKNIREQKRKEREIREENHKSDEDIIKHLEDLEIMEEIYNELDQLDVDDDTLQKILSGETSLPPEKKRVSYYSEKTDNVIIGNKANNKNLTNNSKTSDDLDEITDTYNNLYISNREEHYQLPYTNNNTITNNNDFLINQEESDSSSDEDIPEEIRAIEKEASGLTKKKKLKFLKEKLKECSQAIMEIKPATIADIDNKLNKEYVRDFLIDFIEMAKDEYDDEEPIEISFNDNHPIITQDKNIVKKKKRIRFSNEDQIRIIDKNERVSASATTSHTSIIKKNINKSCLEKNIPSDISFVDKRQNILEKVERNCNLVAEKQSQGDFDLIGKILNASKKDECFQITFQHSDKHFEYPNYENENVEGSEEIVKHIGSPADIYKVFNNYFPENLQTKVFQIQTDTNGNESGMEILNKRVETTNSMPDKIVATTLETTESEKNPETKSILKNKEAVNKEKHVEAEMKKNSTKKNKKRPEQQKIDDFETILGDIVENRNGENDPPTKPDPLPKGKFVDAHAPKKRVSRFKQLRSGNTI